MAYNLERMTNAHAADVIRIFNHYVESDFSAYIETPVPAGFFAQIEAMIQGYPALVAVAADGSVAGFAFVRPFHPAPTFRRTAELTYFIDPAHTRKGLGGRMLERLASEARVMGVDRLLANISSRNADSLAFHRKHGFEECGRLPKVGRKFGEDFDIVYVHRAL